MTCPRLSFNCFLNSISSWSLSLSKGLLPACNNLLYKVCHLTCQYLELLVLRSSQHNYMYFDRTLNANKLISVWKQFRIFIHPRPSLITSDFNFVRYTVTGQFILEMLKTLHILKHQWVCKVDIPLMWWS